MLRRMAAVFLEQRDRWILWLPVPLAGGIGLYFSLLFEPPLWLGAAVMAVLVACILPFRENKAVVLGWTVVFLFALGFSAAQFRTWHVGEPLLKKKTYPAPVVTGRVVLAEARDTSYRVTLEELEGVAWKKGAGPARVRVNLKKNDTAVPEEGDVVRVKAVLMPLPMPVLPGSYDFARRAYFDGTGATGYAISPLETVRKREGGYVFENLRRRIRDKVYAADLAPDNIEGLTVAFMVGDEGGITEEDWETARESGIAHLIAISGSHFAMIVGLVFFAVRALLAAFPYIALRWPIKKIAAGAGMLMAVFYVLLIGAPVSAQRAAVMSCIVLTAIILDRDPFTLRIAAFAAVVLLLFEPEILFGAGFQMSFAAVTGLIAFFEGTREWWSGVYRTGGILRRAGLFLVMCLVTTVVASVAVMPYTFFHFLRGSMLAGLVANMVAVPVSSFITFPLAFLAALLMPFGLETYPLLLAERSIALFMRVAEIVVGWGDIGVSADAWPMCWLVVITFGGLWVCLWQGWMRWLGVLPILIALAFIQVRERPDVLAGGRFHLLAAVKDGSGVLWFSPGRKDRFAREVWTEREGGAGTETWPEEGKAAGGLLECTPRACTYTKGGHSVVFVKDGSSATEEDCKADVVETPEAEKPAFDCAAIVLDKWTLYRRGTHLLYMREGEPLRMTNISDWRGDRPWVWPKRDYAPRGGKKRD